MNILKTLAIITLEEPNSGGVYQYTLTMLSAFKLLEKQGYRIKQIRSASFPIFFRDNILYSRNSDGLFIKSLKFLNVYLGNKGWNFLSSRIFPDELLDFIKDVELVISPSITLLPYFMGKKYFVTLHDFQHKYYPKFFTIKERLYRNYVYRSGLYAERIIVESEYVKQDVEKFLGIPESRVKVLESPPPTYVMEANISDSEIKKVKEKYNLPDVFLFYPAQFWPHKNHINLLKALDILRKQFGITISVVFTGTKQNYFNKVFNEVRKLKLEKQVMYLGYVGSEELVALYRLARALVLPTLFESISIPIWEAFFQGCPVLASNVCALPEQVGNAGLLFDPKDPLDIAEKISKIIKDDALREELIKKGKERVQNLTLESYASKIRELIESVL